MFVEIGDFETEILFVTTTQIVGGRYTPENLASGCRATGIRPLDNNAIRQENLKPSLSYTKESSSLDLPATATPITGKATSIFQKHFKPSFQRWASSPQLLQRAHDQ